MFLVPSCFDFVIFNEMGRVCIKGKGNLCSGVGCYFRIGAYERQGMLFNFSLFNAVLSVLKVNIFKGACLIYEQI